MSHWRVPSQEQIAIAPKRGRVATPMWVFVWMGLCLLAAVISIPLGVALASC